MSRVAVLSIVTLFLSAAPANAQTAIEGRWQKGSMEIDIGPCGDNLCGTVVKASGTQRERAQRGSGIELIGATLIRNIRQTRPGHYRALVFVADRNAHATGRIRQVSHDLLRVSGCVLAIICKSANWTRVR